MNDLSRFVTFMAVSAGVFVALLLFAVRKREAKPHTRTFILTTLVSLYLECYLRDMVIFSSVRPGGSTTAFLHW